MVYMYITRPIALYVVQSYYYNVAAAICVSSQELTSTLRDRSRACPNEEVIFTCTVRGSPTLTTLILAWSSTEYIGQGVNPLRFTTDDVQGETRLSIINGNVTATLINNTNIDGVPTLVSEMRIVADQNSTVTCTSQTNSSSMSTTLIVSGMYNVCNIHIAWHGVPLLWPLQSKVRYPVHEACHTVYHSCNYIRNFIMNVHIL